MRRGYADGPHGQVHYRLAGPDGGPPVVLLHQSPSSSMQFERVYPLLIADGWRVVGIDTPGFGMSDAPPRLPGIADYAAAVPPVMDALGIDAAAVVGHHTGAQTAVHLAVADPARVQAVVVSGPPLLTGQERADLAARDRHPPAPVADGTHLQATWDLRLAGSKGWWDVPSMHRGVVETLVAGELAWWGHAAAFGYDMEPALTALTQPLCIVTNSGDVLHRQSLRAAQLRPDARLAELEGGTHDVVDELPGPWARAVSAFLRQAGLL
jgi:pimeloyl-ACP methyl ester carboxylesterase